MTSKKKMSATHPVHTLLANLRTRRLDLVQTIAKEGASSSQLKELAMLQCALMAIREEIEVHAPKLGWGGGHELD